MKLFGFNKKAKKFKFRITEPDREWVEDNFQWLISVYGYPDSLNDPIRINANYFPRTFNSPNVTVENLIGDLASLLELDPTKITFELQEDLRDTYGIPYEIHDKPFESETLITENTSKIVIAKSLLKHPDRLIFSLIYEFIKIRLGEDKLDYDTGDDTSLSIYLAGVYAGFGTILSQNFVDKGRADDGFWETKWNYVSEMPKEVMAFALALYSKLSGEDNPEWEDHLPNDFITLFDQAIIYLNDSPSPLLDKKEIEANNLLYQADKEYRKNNFDSAIATLQKILFLTEDELLKADVYNNIGYYQTRKGEFEQSVSNFRKSIELDPDNGYALDNLGYSLIRTGGVEEGKSYIEKAMETENNDHAYSYRNLALYYQSKGDIALAEENFKLAFKSMVGSVDLLEYYYAEFLLTQGKSEKAMEYLQKAAGKMEPEAIKRIRELEKK